MKLRIDSIKDAALADRLSVEIDDSHDIRELFSNIADEMRFKNYKSSLKDRAEFTVGKYGCEVTYFSASNPRRKVHVSTSNI